MYVRRSKFLMVFRFIIEINVLIFSNLIGIFIICNHKYDLQLDLLILIQVFVIKNHLLNFLIMKLEIVNIDLKSEIDSANLILQKVFGW